VGESSDAFSAARIDDISTTVKYYVGQNAESTADALWAAVGNSQGNTHERNKNGDRETTEKTSTGERT
jgi:outer membrane protease